MADLAKLQKNLEERGFTVTRFHTAAQAADYLDAALDGKSVGIGGSVTIQEMGLAERLGRNTPCAAKGDRCYDCKSPERICRALVVYWEKPGSMDMEVVLVDEDLGY